MTERVEARRKSPRAPTVPLDEALERALKIYEKERLHAVPTEIATKHMGYGSANGASLQALASLRYYGLLERPKDGLVAVSKDVEGFKFAPSEALKQAFVRKFLSTPPLFAELLDRVQSHMPSDETLRYELIQRGFLPASAAVVGSVFRRSVEFAGPLQEEKPSAAAAPKVSADVAVESASEPTGEGPARHPVTAETSPSKFVQSDSEVEEGHDRIPVRLPGGRRAWIVVPAMLYTKDKARLKAQIDLLLTQDEEDEE